MWCLLIATVSLHAQKLTVEKMEVAPMDLSASTQPRNDRNGNPCALVKVQLATQGASFEGSVIGDTEFKKGEYWVYMSAGSYMLNIKHSSFLPLFVNFRDYDIKRVEGKTTYVLTLLMPQGLVPEQTQKLTINYSPANAMVIIDSTPHQGNGHLEVELPVGSHNYQIVAVGYASAEGSVKLNADMPRTVTEHLVPKGEVAQQQQTQVVVQQPVQQQPVDEFEGKTAQQIADIAEDYYYGRNGKTKDYAEAVKWYRKAAEQGNADAQYSLGYCYYKGRGVAKDCAEAVRWIRKAADQGNIDAQCNLGYFYYSGEGVTKDLDKAKELLRKAAAQGNQMAKDKLEELFGATTQVEQQPQTQVVADEFEGKTASEIADIAEDYYYGRNGKTQDYAEAVKWARKAAELGNSLGQFRLGSCYTEGKGVTHDYVEAVKWYRKAADQGYAGAQISLGLCYYHGQGITQDYGEAVKWCRKAEEQGDADALIVLGILYYNGEGVPFDLKHALELWSKAAAQGNAWAQDTLGDYYYNGDIVTQDYAEAVKWYRKAADQGEASAQNNLGFCYFNGQGVTQDYAEAVKWYRKAVDQGNADAQNNLGNCYYDGEGVTQDRNKAKELWRKSAAQGNQLAKNNLKKYFGETY